MIYRKLGRTDLEISALALGCYQITSEYGGTAESAAAILKEAYESGVNYFDTAPCYNRGESEEYVGRFSKAFPESGVYVNDKVGRYAQWNAPPAIPGNYVRDPESYYTDPAEIKRAVKHSLWLLQRDHFDVLSIHEPDWPVWQIDYKSGDSAVLCALEELKAEGVTRYIGLGGWNCHVNAMLVDTGRIDVVMAAGGMNLLAKPIFDELLPAARRNGTGIVLGGALGQGNPLLLSQDRTRLEKLHKREDARADVTFRQLKELYDICDQMNITMVELAVRYVLSFDSIHSHAAGARNPDHLRENVKAINKGPLPQDVFDAIESLHAYGEGLSTREISALIMKDI